ncbi:hypothetical protein CI109_102633 [Kwoniella shandongensis]|uniref:Uncharacterized protein n=1 Tax=Kwoniella shandongensis TaxID=1734106 RepID=A0A5M6BYC0_9TREE|nr:uncharacterized protein CI109_005214 [Kwoniella shandongensis]KAA5526445.1 hypothetical protein CI109_005214 [Kwoniella shandongensis]
MSLYEPFCKPCKRATGISYPLERDPGGIYACPSCGREDTSVTSVKGYVDVTAAGLVVDETVRAQSREMNWDYIEYRFKQDVKDIMHFYLGIPDHRTSIIGIPGIDLLPGVEKWFERIREVEKEHYGRRHRLSNPNVKRLRYMVAIAIKMAVQESVSIVINNRLAALGIKRSELQTPGFTKGDENIPNVRLDVMFARANQTSEDSFAHLSSKEYLSNLHRRFAKLLRNPFSPLESTLFNVLQISQRLRKIVETPHSKRSSLLLTQPLLLKGERDWNESDFEFFDNLAWDKILPYAYNFYQLQRSIMLWGNKSTSAVAIALTVWATQAIKASVMPQRNSIMQELAAPYGHQHWVAAARSKELQNLLIAWSTSLPDAGLPFPTMPLPPKGGLGDGLAGYNGDKRRPLPENDMAAILAPVIVKHWRTILRARCRTRSDVMPYEEELWLSRKMFIVKAACHDPPLIPRARHSKAPTGADKKPIQRSTQGRYRKRAEEARLAIQDFEPLRRVLARSTPTAVPGSQSPRNSATPQSRPSSIGPEINVGGGRRSFLPQQTRFVPPPKEPTVEDLLAVREASSDEGSNRGSSDDEEQPGVSLSAFGLGLAGAAKSHRPFAFTIGPKGFNIESQDQVDQPTAIPLLPNGRLNSTKSPSASLMSRKSSTGTESGAGSASEAEKLVPVQRIWPANPHLLRAGATPSGSNSPFPTASGSSRGASPASSTFSTISLVNGQEDAHVGLLVREREEYVKFRMHSYVESGQTVGPECEEFMWKWIRKQVQFGSIPSKITRDYLRSIGMRGDPRMTDLGPWIESKKQMWSPVESLLRAGIKPKEIPTQYIPHSILHLDLMLNHYNTMTSECSTLYAPVGQAIDDQQLDKELTMLFVTGAGEELSFILMTEQESKKREESYRRAKIWLGDSDGTLPVKQPRKKNPIPGLATERFDEKEDEDLVEYEYENEYDNDDDDFEGEETDTVASTGYTSAITTPGTNTINIEEADERREARHELHRIRSTIRHSGMGVKSKSKDQMEALAKALGEGESEETGIAEAMLGGLAWHEMGLGLEMEMDGGDGDDGGDGEAEDEDGQSGKKRKRTANTGNGKKAKGKSASADEVNKKRKVATSHAALTSGEMDEEGQEEDEE